ncbi:DEAD/DEAH box helicase family protein [Streptomyces sp. PmtA]|uniref:DEAD/DEAH box helicase family protein n=1 Tax=Streptomyces sp. PmtA TaxID=3074275 RepID=UPI003014A2B1
MNRLDLQIPATSYLEAAFLRWVLSPAVDARLASRVVSQHPVTVNDRTYRLDYLVTGLSLRLAVELDGFAFHSDRAAFTYDRLRQNDLAAAGFTVVRFSYDAVRTDTERCVRQLQAMLLRDSELAPFVVADPKVEVPDMAGDAMRAADPPTGRLPDAGFFTAARARLDRGPLRTCQEEALEALANYYAAGGRHAATVMAVGAGKTALGVAATLSFSRRRALVVTPGSVIRGTFAKAFDPGAPGNAIYGLPRGPLLPGSSPPTTLVLDREDGRISAVTREQLLAADVLVTNFHALGTGARPGDLLAKLKPQDIDFIVVDEAHIAAADSYQRLFAHFDHARTLLMSACFQRRDGKPIDADVVYRYRLVDSIADRTAKNLRVHRFAPDSAATVYEAVWPGRPARGDHRSGGVARGPGRRAPDGTYHGAVRGADPPCGEGYEGMPGSPGEAAIPRQAAGALLGVGRGARPADCPDRRGVRDFVRNAASHHVGCRCRPDA